MSKNRFKLTVNLKFCQSYPEKSREKTNGHVVRSPQALSRVLSLELKGHLNCRMCPEWDLDLMYPTEAVGCSRALETENIEYWNVKGQVAAAESPV
jgi:hypothetical protein